MPRLQSCRPGYFDRAFDEDPGWQPSPLDAAPAYLPRVLTGGYPEAVSQRDDAARAAWFEAYLETAFMRDVRDAVDVKDLGRLRRLLDLVAARSGQLLKPATVARDADPAASTARSWIDALALARLVDIVPVWSGGQRARLVGTPKGFVSDSGLLAEAIACDAAALLGSPILLGSAIETFVVQELLRQRTWADARVRVYHYRDRDQREVDCVLEHRDGRIVGIEVKSATVVHASDASGLRALRAAAGGRFHRGVVLYCGSLPRTLETGIDAVPIADLWAR